MVDEMERSVHDALCVVKRVLESHLVVPGGGAVETALSVYLENFARTLVGERQEGLISVLIFIENLKTWNGLIVIYSSCVRL